MVGVAKILIRGIKLGVGRVKLLVGGVKLLVWGVKLLVGGVKLGAKGVMGGVKGVKIVESSRMDIYDGIRTDYVRIVSVTKYLQGVPRNMTVGE